MLVHGLFMDASRWDDEAMIVADPKIGEMNPTIPVMHMKPEMSFTPDPADYIAPLYKTGLRAGTLSTTGQLSRLVSSSKSLQKQTFLPLMIMDLINLFI